MLLALCACGGKGEEKKANVFQVGFGRVDLTPTSPMDLVGYTENRLMTGVLDPIYATCVAITDAKGNTVLIYTVDRWIRAAALWALCGKAWQRPRASLRITW